MSRTYDALRRAEAERRTVPPDVGPQAKSRSANGNGATRLEYEKIRVWLKNPVAQGQRLQTVMVVACHSGAGGTTTAGLLATTLARGKKSRVLILDTNFRTPGMNLFFKTRSNGHGEVAPVEDFPFASRLQQTDQENLFVLTSDYFAVSPLESFEDELDDMLSELRKRFDYIVFDAPPALDFPDAYSLAPKVDGIILVVESERTLIEDAQIAKRDLERAGGKVMGVVLNRHETYLPRLLRRFFS